MVNPIQYHNTDNKRLSVKMNGFNSKVVCKNSSVTIWEILFNIAIPITRGGFVKRLQYAPPGRTERGGLMKTLHRRTSYWFHLNSTRSDILEIESIFGTFGTV